MKELTYKIHFASESGSYEAFEELKPQHTRAYVRIWATRVTKQILAYHAKL